MCEQCDTYVERLENIRKICEGPSLQTCEEVVDEILMQVEAALRM